MLINKPPDSGKELLLVKEKQKQTNEKESV